MSKRPYVNFEVGGSVILVGNDLQFVGMAGSKRIRFVISHDALKRLNGAPDGLTPQQKFKMYDRNRELLHDIGRRLYEQASKDLGIVNIAARDL